MTLATINVDRRKHVNPTGQPARPTARQLVLDTAERLFVEQGVLAVSNRQIGEAAGYGNSAVVGYHFGTNADLVRAITRRFTAEVERSRVSMLAELAQQDGPVGVRDLLACMVLPWTDHFAALGPRSYFAQLCAQALNYPSLRTIITEEATGSPSLRQTIAALNRHLPFATTDMANERGAIMEYAIVYTCAERERVLADGTPTPSQTWQDTAAVLIDALVGIWTAPTTAGPRRLAPTEPT